MNEQFLIQNTVELFKKGEFKRSLIEANIILSKNKDLNKSHFFNNLLGLINLSLKDWERSIYYFNKCIVINNKILDPYFNLGIVYYDLGELSKSLEYFLKINEKFNDHKQSTFAIIKLLTFINPDNKSNNYLIDLNNKFQKINFNIDFTKKINDQNIYEFLNIGDKLIKNDKRIINFNENQIFRRNKIDLNCERHKKIFNKYKTIPSYCFGCIKIVIYLENILDLIKLTIFFDQYKNLYNFDRKCMVDKINNQFKGFIYHSDVDEAKQYLSEIKPIIEIILDKKIETEIKRGCTEFSKEYPYYKRIEKMMIYPNEWKINEINYDNLHYKDGIEKRRIKLNSLIGFTLSDFLIYKKWTNNY